LRIAYWDCTKSGNGGYGNDNNGEKDVGGGFGEEAEADDET